MLSHSKYVAMVHFNDILLCTPLNTTKQNFEHEIIIQYNGLSSWAPNFDNERIKRKGERRKASSIMS
jgi:hypothetical protein